MLTTFWVLPNCLVTLKQEINNYPPEDMKGEVVYFFTASPHAAVRGMESWYIRILLGLDLWATDGLDYTAVRQTLAKF